MAADSRAYDTTASTYERDRRRHLAVPLKAPAAARALQELSAVYPLLAAALAPAAAAVSGSGGAAAAAVSGSGGPAAAADDDDSDDAPAAISAVAAGLRLVESGLLLTLPGAAAQRPHADTDGSGREEGAPIAYSENNHATYIYIATLPITLLRGRRAARGDVPMST